MLDPDVRHVRLQWSGEGMVFHGGPEGGASVTIDSSGAEGQSPMQLLLMSLAGCMAIDVLMILEKSRVPVDALAVEVTGKRAPSAPKRYLSIRLGYELEGPSEEDGDKLGRAIALSKDKYCSVLHTLDPDIDFDITVERT